MVRAPKRKLSVNTDTSIESEIAHLRDLDLKGLRARWHRAFRKPAPDHLPRHLLFGMLAYHLQADAFGDLDAATRRTLGGSATCSAKDVVAKQLDVLDQRRTQLKPGTVLIREWKGRQHRVTVMADGFSWKSKTYKSLSELAYAITGTRWNGPRFFGLRNQTRNKAEALGS
jgi:hypothetical protein